MRRRNRFSPLLLALVCAAAAPAAARDTTERPGELSGKLGSELFMAVIHQDKDGVNSLLKAGADVNSRNGLDLTPFHFAAATGQIDVMDALVKAGAKIDTPTPYGTAFTFAAEFGSVPAMRYLLSHGASITPSRADRTTLLMLTARGGSADVIKELLKRKADVNARDNDGATALMYAARDGQVEAARLLLAAGAAVDAVDTHGRTALMYAAMNGQASFARLLLASKAKPGLRDKDGRTALQLAARFGDHPEVARLLKNGASPGDVKAAAAVAAGRGYAATAAALGGANGKSAPARDSRQAVSASLKSLEVAMRQFNQRTGCVSCHHEGLGRMATGAARERGFALDAALRDLEQKRVGGAVNGMASLHQAALKQPEMMKKLPLFEMGEVPFSYVWMLGGMAFEKEPATEAAAAMALVLARQQLPNGMWHQGGPRVPMQSTPFTTTSLTILGLNAYGAPADAAEITERIQRGKSWLLSTPARNSEEKAYRLLGLKWAGATEPERKTALEELRSAQLPDGGWAQLPEMKSDAYATGQALYALSVGGEVPTTDPAFRRGLRYLLRTQEADGSWFVSKRAVPLNNYFDAGFPHGQSQYSSFNGTCWATLALLQTIPAPGKTNTASGR